MEVSWVFVWILVVGVSGIWRVLVEVDYGVEGKDYSCKICKLSSVVDF